MSCSRYCHPSFVAGGRCTSMCAALCPHMCHDTLPPPPLPPPPPPEPPPPHTHQISPILVIIICALGSFFILVAYYIIVLKYYWGENSSRRRDSSTAGEGSLDAVVGSPFCMINTVDIQSVVDLISVIKYKKEESQMEETECCVCLNEFQEEESVRILPNCNHVFHLPCIDTWLRSHKNCPLCRAPVACQSVTSHVNVVEQNASASGSWEP